MDLAWLRRQYDPLAFGNGDRFALLPDQLASAELVHQVDVGTAAEAFDNAGRASKARTCRRLCQMFGPNAQRDLAGCGQAFRLGRQPNQRTVLQPDLRILDIAADDLALEKIHLW